MIAAHYDEHGETWRQWQIGNAKSNRRASIQARVGLAILLTGAAVWLALQLLASPAWS